MQGRQLHSLPPPPPLPRSGTPANAFEIAQELDIGPVFLNQEVKKKENENRKREYLVTMQTYIV